MHSITGRIWRELLGCQMLALDSIMPTHRSALRPCLTPSPYTQRMLDLNEPEMQQHRLFCFLDLDSDGIISIRDVRSWLHAHLRFGSLTFKDALECKEEQCFDGDVDLDEEERQDLQKSDSALKLASCSVASRLVQVCLTTCHHHRD